MADSETYFTGGVVVACPMRGLTPVLSSDIQQQYGTVSQESAIAMAQAVRAQFNATFGLGITGVPGPGACAGKPVGLAYFAIASAETVHTQEMRVAPRRVTLKRRVSNAALIELSKLLRGAMCAHIEAHW
jgi:nicotinamide-nucleotide amidase